MPNVTCHPDDDREVGDIADALAGYAESHERAEITIHRASRETIHVRIIDPSFKGLNRVARENLIWPLLEPLPDETFTQITVLLLVTPQEIRKSFANMIYFGPPDPAPAAV